MPVMRLDRRSARALGSTGVWWANPDSFGYGVDSANTLGADTG